MVAAHRCCTHLKDAAAFVFARVNCWQVLWFESFYDTYTRTNKKEHLKIVSYSAYRHSLFDLELLMRTACQHNEWCVRFPPNFEHLTAPLTIYKWTLWIAPCIWRHSDAFSCSSFFNADRDKPLWRNKPQILYLPAISPHLLKFSDRISEKHEKVSALSPQRDLKISAKLCQKYFLSLFAGQSRL